MKENKESSLFMLIGLLKKNRESISFHNIGNRTAKGKPGWATMHPSQGIWCNKNCITYFSKNYNIFGFVYSLDQERSISVKFTDSHPREEFGLVKIDDGGTFFSGGAEMALGDPALGIKASQIFYSPECHQDPQKLLDRLLKILVDLEQDGIEIAKGQEVLEALPEKQNSVSKPHSDSTRTHAMNSLDRLIVLLEKNKSNLTFHNLGNLAGKGRPGWATMFGSSDPDKIWCKTNCITYFNQNYNIVGLVYTLDQDTRINVKFSVPPSREDLGLVKVDPQDGIFFSGGEKKTWDVLPESGKNNSQIFYSSECHQSPEKLLDSLLAVLKKMDNNGTEIEDRSNILKAIAPQPGKEPEGSTVRTMPTTSLDKLISSLKRNRDSITFHNLGNLAGEKRVGWATMYGEHDIQCKGNCITYYNNNYVINRFVYSLDQNRRINVNLIKSPATEELGLIKVDPPNGIFFSGGEEKTWDDLPESGRSNSKIFYNKECHQDPHKLLSKLLSFLEKLDNENIDLQSDRNS